MNTRPGWILAGWLGFAAFCPATEPPALQFTHRVAAGSGDVDACAGAAFVSGRAGAVVVHCLEVVNTGTNVLELTQVSLPQAGTSFSPGRLAPGAVWSGLHRTFLSADTTVTSRVSAVIAGSATLVSDSAAVRLDLLEDCPNACIALSDVEENGGPDRAYQLDLFSGALTEVGLVRPQPAVGAAAHCLEACAFHPPQFGVPMPLLFAVDAGPSCENGPLGTTHLANQGYLGTIDWADASNAGIRTWTPMANPIGVGRGVFGLVPFNDVDGMSFDASPSGGGELHIAVRQNGERDLLSRVDVVSGRLVPDAFGHGVDYLPMAAVTDGQGRALEDVDDILFNPLNGELWSVYGGSNTASALVLLDKDTGFTLRLHTIVDEATLEGIQGVADIGFGLDGRLFATTSAAGAPANSLYEVTREGPSAGLARRVAALGGSGDFEAFDCYASAPDSFSMVSGSLVLDANQNGRSDPGETAPAGALVLQWLDVDANRELDPLVDFVIDAVVPSASGEYSFIAPNGEPYLFSVEVAGVPAYCGYSTPPVQALHYPNECGREAPRIPTIGILACVDRPDRDADGLPDAYEAAHGLPSEQDNRGADADADTVPDDWEYVAGTPPRFSGSAGPWLARATLSDGQPTLTFLARRAEGPGYEGLTRRYSIEHRPDLGPGSWEPLPGYTDIPGQGQVVRIPLASTTGFLRARIELR